MSRLQSCSRIFEKSSAVAEKKIPENRTFSEKSEKNARIIPPLTLHGQQHCSPSIFNALPICYRISCLATFDCIEIKTPSWRRRSRQAMACHRLVYADFRVTCVYFVDLPAIFCYCETLHIWFLYYFGRSSLWVSITMILFLILPDQKRQKRMLE